MNYCYLLSYMRVCISLRWDSMCSPTGMSNTNTASDGFHHQLFNQIIEFAHFTAQAELLTVDGGDTCRVVASIL